MPDNWLDRPMEDGWVAGRAWIKNAWMDRRSDRPTDK